MTVDRALMLAMTTAAREQREKAYAPYSKFKVGAAVMGGSGKVYLGSNVENASYGLTVCAERVAIFRAISEGESEIQAVVVCVGEGEPAPPCGACLQVMAEFAPGKEPMTVVTCSADGTCVPRTLHDYLPVPFRATGSGSRASGLKGRLPATKRFPGTDATRREVGRDLGRKRTSE